MSYTEYTKIEMPYKRNPENMKQIMWDTYRSPEMNLLCNAPIQWTEKVDGMNIQVHWDGHKVQYGGRTERADIKMDLVNYLNEHFGGEVNEEMWEQKFGETDVILYGEGYGAGIQKGGAYRNDKSFILFDVLIGGTWLERDAVEDIAKYFGIDVVPIMLTGTLRDAIEYIQTHPTSQVAIDNGGDAEMEGVVGRAPYGLLDRNGRRLIWKVKYKDFKDAVEKGVSK